MRLFFCLLLVLCKMKYYIYAPSYNETSGGSVVLHRLCHILNTIEGCEAFLVPQVPEKLSVTNLRCFIRDINFGLKYLLKRTFGFKPFLVNGSWRTPVLTREKIRDIKRSVVVYPETTFGNPLNGKNVVRWFLHQPGYFTKEVCFGVGELHYKFNSAIRDFNHCLSCLSEDELKVIYYPLEYYNFDPGVTKDLCSHTIRKGKGKPFVHSNESVLIDGLSHKEAAQILKRSKQFISYDPYTAYSIFAALCGCVSIVIPDPGVTKEQWYPRETDRNGIAYGLDQNEIDMANITREKVLAFVLNEHEKSRDEVLRFVRNTSSFFSLNC